MHIEPIATIDTPFSEKFAIPRQSQIVDKAVGQIQFVGDYHCPESLHGLEAHSHYWLIWGFHHHSDKTPALTVRPPRLGGNQRVGVFATRSPFRPNHLGLSVVRLLDIDQHNGSIRVAGVDMLSGTPVYDLKPYIPYADCLQEACSDWASEAPAQCFDVCFTDQALIDIHTYDARSGHDLKGLIEALLAYDARPAYKDKPFDDKIYATTLYNMDIAWRIDVQQRMVTIISAQALTQ